MINIKDFGKIKAQYIACWNRENHDAPLLLSGTTKDGAKWKERNPSLLERWTDMTYILETARERMENTCYGGASFPLLNPNLGPDIFGATLGCEIEFGESTSWAHPVETPLAEMKLDKIDPNNPWYQKIVSMTKAAVADAAGDYLVGITDLHGGMDGMVSLRGPEQLCIDMVEEPELVTQRCVESFGAFRQLYTELHQIITAKQEGSSNWMSVYHPKGWYVSSCDLICMISPTMFEDFVLPELKLELDLFGNSIFHLDGPGALRHLDRLLELPELDGVQWVYGAGQATAAHWIPVLKKIQDAGKMVHILATHEDLPVLKEHLRPEGLMINTGAKNETELRDLERYIQNWNRK